MIARESLEARALIRIDKGASTGGRRPSIVFALPSDQIDQKRQRTADELLGRLSALRAYGDHIPEDVGRLNLSSYVVNDHHEASGGDVEDFGRLNLLAYVVDDDRHGAIDETTPGVDTPGEFTV